jgi:hypothetical protein
MKTPPLDEVGGGASGWQSKTENTSLAQNAPSPQALLRQLELARQRLDRLTDDLETIANWKDEFRDRLWRARLRFELIGLADEEYQRLLAEACELKRACRAIRGPEGRRS